MKKALTIVFVFWMSFLKAQLYDAQWALGYNESVLDFRVPDTVGVYSIPTIQYFFLTSASICDEVGNLLYYTNGIAISGINNILLNGSGLNPCSFTEQDSLNGLPIPQGALFIPKPGSNRYYYLFHFSNDAANDSRPGTIYYSIVDKEEDAGRGAVTEKNIPLFQGVVLREGGMTACKHANGRDYWIVMGGGNNNKFYEFLLTPDGIQGPFIQNIGPVFPTPYDVAYSKFSQDGSKYVTGIYVGANVLVMDFDRCTGIFVNPITIVNNASSDPQHPISGIGSAEFSSNGRFIYATNSVDINQYDLLSATIQDSTQIYHGDSTDFHRLRILQLAINGKIYGTTFNGNLKALHVINKPDLKGDSADFVYGGQPTLTINSINVPNLINYKLGPLLGSGCDTITSVEQPTVNSQGLRIIPNPANKFAYIEMGMQGNYKFELLNISGQITDTKETRQIDIFDTEQLAAGEYFIRVIDKTTGAELAVKKVVIAH